MYGSLNRRLLIWSYDQRGQALYLVGSEVNICCVPCILALAPGQTQKISKGFGGNLFGMDETIQHMHE